MSQRSVGTVPRRGSGSMQASQGIRRSLPTMAVLALTRSAAASALLALAATALPAQHGGPGSGLAAGVEFRGPAVLPDHRGAGIAIRVARDRPLSANLGWRAVGLAAFTTSSAEGGRAWGFNGLAGIAAGPGARGAGPYLRVGAGAVGITTSEPGTGGRTDEIAVALGGYGAAGVELKVGQRLAFVEGFAVVPSTGKFGSAFLGVLLGVRRQASR